ncbi:MAG TPA: D-alanyl-D-alanine carboxypeptidase family protein [Bacillota bacterium]|nr:D-alanyl-D-alanine carboxypeptidase family protein [Bacillota bacterium]
MVKKIGWLLMIFSVGFMGSIRPVWAFSIEAKAAILMDPVSGKILYAQNEHQRLPPASVTKVMTMLLIMEAVESGRIGWDEKIVTSKAAAGMGGSQIYLKEGEEMTLREMFKAIAVVSANDASTAIAEHLYGSDIDFVEAMNNRAQKLKLKNTHFANETGLPDPEHYSSAYDLAVISRELLKYPEVLKFTSIWMDSLRDGKFILRNTNELIRVYRGADGLKTGHTSEAKYCLAATAKKGDFRLLSVILGAESDAARVAQTKRLLDYGFRNFQWKPVFESKKVIGRVYIKGAKQEQVSVQLRSDFGVVVERGKELVVTTRITPDKNIKLPIKSGARIGTVSAVLEGKIIGQAPVYAAENVEEANFLVKGWRWIRDFFKSLFSKKTEKLNESFERLY